MNIYYITRKNLNGGIPTWVFVTIADTEEEAIILLKEKYPELPGEEGDYSYQVHPVIPVGKGVIYSRPL